MHAAATWFRSRANVTWPRVGALAVLVAGAVGSLAVAGGKEVALIFAGAAAAAFAMGGARSDRR